MRRFRFKLQAVERVRKLAEERALYALAEAQRARSVAIAKKEALQAKLALSLARREELGRVAIPASAFQLETAHIEGLKVWIAAAEYGVRKAQKKVDQTMRAYLAARRSLKSIEMLRDRQRAAFRMEENKREAKAVDDLVSMRHRLMGSDWRDDGDAEQGLLREEESA